MLLPLLQSSVPASTGLSLLQIVQTAGVIVALAALLFTGLGFFLRVREQRFQNYLGAMSGFVDLQKMMIENEKLHVLYEHPEEEDLKKLYKEMSPEDLARIHYCDALIALCETVWRAYKDKWLREDEWQYWKQWIQDLSASPYFRWTLEWVEKDYNKEFLKALTEITHSRRVPKT